MRLQAWACTCPAATRTVREKREKANMFKIGNWINQPKTLLASGEKKKQGRGGEAVKREKVRARHPFISLSPH